MVVDVLSLVWRRSPVTGEKTYFITLVEFQVVIVFVPFEGTLSSSHKSRVVEDLALRVTRRIVNGRG